MSDVTEIMRERDQYRAEVERLRGPDDTGDDSLYNVRRLRVELSEAKARAERAELTAAAWKARALLAEKHRAENERGWVEAQAEVERLRAEFDAITDQHLLRVGSLAERAERAEAALKAMVDYHGSAYHSPREIELEKQARAALDAAKEAK